MIRVLFALAFVAAPLYATAQERPTVAIIGTGDLAGVTGPVISAPGYTVVYGSRNPDRESVRAQAPSSRPATTDFSCPPEWASHEAVWMGWSDDTTHHATQVALAKQLERRRHTLHHAAAAEAAVRGDTRDRSW